MNSRLAWLTGLIFVAACSDATLELPRAPSDPDVEDADADDDAGARNATDSGKRPDASNADAALAPDAGTTPIKDAAPDGAAVRCTTTFGKSVWPGHGRLDGIVRAVIVAGDPMCPSDNDHVIVQIDSGGATYPVWINVESSNPTTFDKRVRVATPSLALPAPAWTDGWHDNLTLDYPSLGLHSTSAFTPMSLTALGAFIVAKVPAGARVSAYAYGFNSRDGAHKVHRNLGNDDGALVVLGSGAPTWLAFHFASQAF